MGKLRQTLRADLEAPEAERAFGSGWISGVLALALAVMGLGAVVFLMFPSLFSMPVLRDYYGYPWFRFGLHLMLVSAFALAVLNLVLRRQKIMGFAAIAAILLATLLGGSRTQSQDFIATDYYLGLDWFLINIALLGVLFIPLERMFAKRPEQPVFRMAWREDLFYFLINSLLVQSLTYLSLTPATTLVAHTDWGTLRGFMAAQPLWLQFLEIVVVTDLTQYWVHRVFHRVPALWRFHAVHHVDLDLDASTAVRFHFGELTISVPWRAMQVACIGVSPRDLKLWQQALLVSVLFHHSNVRLPVRLERGLARLVMTPRLHGIHHANRQAIRDANWSSGLTVWDWLHGTLRTDVPQEAIVIGVESCRGPGDVTLPRLLTMPFHKRPRLGDNRQR